MPQPPARIKLAALPTWPTINRVNASLPKNVAAHISVVPLFNLSASSRTLQSNDAKTEIWIEKSHVANDCRYKRKKTAVLSGHLLFPGGYRYVFFILLRADRSMDLDVVIGLFSNTSLTLNCHEFIYTPNDQPFYVGVKQYDDSMHIKQEYYFKPSSNELGNTLEHFRDKIVDAVSQMATTYIDNKLFNELQLLDINDYKKNRMNQYAIGEMTYERMLDLNVDGVCSFHSSSRQVFFSNERYTPDCGIYLSWLGPTWSSIMDFIYTAYAAYLYYKWHPATTSVTGPIVINAFMQRLFLLVSKYQERQVKKLRSEDYTKCCKKLTKKQRYDLYFKKMAVLLKYRIGIPCKDFKESVKESCCASAAIIMMHYYVYSKLRHLFRMPSNILIWSAYLSGVEQLFDSNVILLVGIVLGAFESILRVILDHADVKLAESDFENIFMFLAGLFYGICYTSKDMIALGHSLLYMDDAIKYRNQTSINNTLSQLVDGLDPWSNYSKVYASSYINQIPTSYQSLIIAAIILMSLLGYSLFMARSYKKSNPPGSRRFGFTGFVDCCGMGSFLGFIPSDIHFSVTQAGEMLFGLQIVNQLCYTIGLFDSDAYIYMTMNMVLFAGIGLGAIFGMVNFILACCLCCPGPQQWLQILNIAKFHDADLAKNLHEVHIDFLHSQHSNDSGDNRIVNAVGFIEWLSADNYQIKTKVWNFLQHVALHNHWKILMHIMQQEFPCLYIQDLAEWKELHRMLLKSSPQELVVVAKAESLRRLVKQGLTESLQDIASQLDEKPQKLIKARGTLWARRTGNNAQHKADPNLSQFATPRQSIRMELSTA